MVYKHTIHWVLKAYKYIEPSIPHIMFFLLEA